MQFSTQDIIVLIMAGIIIVCGITLAGIWIAESVMTAIQRSCEDDLDDTIPFEWNHFEGGKDHDDDQ